MIYKLIKDVFGKEFGAMYEENGCTVAFPFNPDNTDYANFKKAVLDQEPGGAVVEDGESFSLNTNPDASILEDADGNVMTIDEAKAYVRTLP